MKWLIGAGVAVVVIAMIAVSGLVSLLFISSAGVVVLAAPCTNQASVIPASGQVNQSMQGLAPNKEVYAKAVIDAGRARGMDDYGIVIALATVAQESSFRMVANSGSASNLKPEQRDVSRSTQLPHDVVADDAGSVGLFAQQYPWWGTLEELMDPTTSANLFYDALLKVDGWQQMPVTVAAQTVQKSAFPDAYARHEPMARALLAQLGGGFAPSNMADVQCGPGGAMVCPVPTPIDDGLTPDAIRVARCVQQEFGEMTMLGKSSRPNNPNSDHPTGRAVDIMIDDWQGVGGNKGTEIAEWTRMNAAGLGVTYIIWNRQIWKSNDPAAGWQPYSHPSGGSNPTLDHQDHVHVSVYGNAAGMAPGMVSASGEWGYPVAPGTYRVSSGYGPRRSPGGIGSTFHRGTDLAAPTGTPVSAACTGMVTYAGGRGGYGNFVQIDCGGGVTTSYAHLSSIAVGVNQPIVAGMMLGAVGSTGNSTGPHLHFEVRVGGAAIDPEPWMRNVGINLRSPNAKV